MIGTFVLLVVIWAWGWYQFVWPSVAQAHRKVTPEDARKQLIMGEHKDDTDELIARLDSELNKEES